MHTEGIGTRAGDDAAHAEGLQTAAYGTASHSEGLFTSAVGFGSHTEGFGTVALNDAAHAEGYYSKAYGLYSHTEGLHTSAYGLGSHAEGFNTFATNSATHAEGYFTVASGFAAHAEGQFSYALGRVSHAAGLSAKAVHDHTWIWGGDSTTRFAISTTRTEQFLVSARQGVFVPGYMAVGVDPFNTSTTPAALYSTQAPLFTVKGLLSSTNTMVNVITADIATFMGSISSAASYQGDGSLLRQITATDYSVTYNKLRYDTIGAAPAVWNINTSDELMLNQPGATLPNKTRVQYLTSGFLHAPVVAKAWAYFTVTAGVVTLVNYYNVAQVTRTATGNYYVVVAQGNLPHGVNSTVLANAVLTPNGSFFGTAPVYVNTYMDQVNNNPYNAAITVFDSTGAYADGNAVYVAIF